MQILLKCLKSCFSYTHLNYQMISVEIFPDKFLNIWETDIAAMKPSAEITNGVLK